MVVNERIEKSFYELVDEGFVKMVSHNPDYWINSKGVVYNFKNQKFTSANIDTDGYLYCSIKKDMDLHKKFRVHRLIAHYFIPNNNPEEKKSINHKDGNKSNNEISNLEWVTHQENMIHSTENNLKIYSNGRCGSHLDVQKVIKIKEMLGNGYTHAEIAKIFNVTRPCITQIASGNRWSDVQDNENKSYKVADKKDKTIKIPKTTKDKIINHKKEKIQKQNKENLYSTIYETIDGETKSITEWIKHFNINRNKVTMRYKRGKRGMELFE